jgi:hypothetical protein
MEGFQPDEYDRILDLAPKGSCPWSAARRAIALPLISLLRKRRYDIRREQVIHVV